MAYVHFDSSYAPCGFLIVRTGGNPYDERDTILVQSDWDYPGIAQAMGWDMGRTEDDCDYHHDSTDGTVACANCGKTPSEFISEAFDWISGYEGEEFEGLDEYLEVTA